MKTFFRSKKAAKLGQASSVGVKCSVDDFRALGGDQINIYYLKGLPLFGRVLKYCKGKQVEGLSERVKGKALIKS